MNVRDALDRLTRDHAVRLPRLGAIASGVWLVLVVLFAWIGPQGQAQGPAGWLFWLVGVFLPLGLIWFAVWSAQSLSLLRHEADELRATLAQMRGVSPVAPPADPAAPRHAAPPADRPAEPAEPNPETPETPRVGQRSQAARRLPPPPRAAPVDTRQARLELETADAPEPTPTELFLALNFPDGPDDHEAIRCLRLALADPGMARLIRAAQDVVTLLAAQGVYMDDLAVTETDPQLWRRFAVGERGADMAGLAAIPDPAAVQTAAAMIRGDEVFRDVAHHFMRHYDKLLARRAQADDPAVLAALAETRSGRAFVLLAQVTGLFQDPA